MTDLVLNFIPELSVILVQRIRNICSIIFLLFSVGVQEGHREGGV